MRLLDYIIARLFMRVKKNDCFRMFFWHTEGKRENLPMQRRISAFTRFGRGTARAAAPAAKWETMHLRRARRGKPCIRAAAPGTPPCAASPRPHKKRRPGGLAFLRGGASFLYFSGVV